MSLASRLYRGEFRTDIIGRRKWWYLFSAIVLLVCIVSMVVRGFVFGIDFKGGTSFQFPARGATVAEARTVVSGAADVNGADTVVQTLSGSKRIQVQVPPLANDKVQAVEAALQQRFGVAQGDISTSEVGSSWGSSVTDKAVQALIAFLIVVMIYIAIRFEFKMAVAAIVALLHDLIVTAGVYSLVGFEVTPSTVIALLTILGFSLYDTVVVFDKVRENTDGLLTSGRRTYDEAANDALNQTIMRSINTSLIALLPVASLLFIGAGLLGAGTLEDLALAQFVGLASGAYSSIFIATPLLVDLRRREPQMRQLAAKVERHRAAVAKEKAAVGAPAGRPAVAGVGTAVLDRGPQNDDPQDAVPDEPATPARTGVPRAPSGAAGRGRPGAGPPRRGGRGGRPGAKKRR